MNGENAPPGAARSDTLFSLRYAVRVLERSARLWHRVDLTLRALALFSGTAAFGALVAMHAGWTLAAGLFFALMQTLEFVVTPSRREHEAKTWVPRYAEILARQRWSSDDELAAAYEDTVAKDPVIVSDALRRIAYNDVVHERGVDAGHLYSLNRWERFVDFIA